MASRLNPAQTAQLENAVAARMGRLREELREELARSGNERYLDLAGSTHDSGDESVADELMDIDNSLVQRRLLELRALERTRRRIADGSANECIDCGLEVGFERLRVNPDAVRCVECQTAYEKAHAAASPPRL